jgi:hypothetical protein
MHPGSRAVVMLRYGQRELGSMTCRAHSSSTRSGGIWFRFYLASRAYCSRSQSGTGGRRRTALRRRSAPEGRDAGDVESHDEQDDS